jgi:hypothetical protein
MISGVGAVGARLTTSTGAWSGAISKISVRWERCTRAGRKCRTVSWSSSHLVPASARGASLRVVVHATGEDDITVQALSHLFPIRW